MKKAVALLAVPALALAACGDGSTPAGEDDGRLSVVTSFYPLEHAIEQVGGEHVAVTNLTPAGGEPHDLELSPRDILTVAQADAVVYLAGFQPAVDDALAEADGATLDVTEDAHLDLVSTTDEGEDHTGESAEEHEGHDHGPQDPHFWLDPMRYADVVDAIAAELGRVDPEHRADYAAGARDMRSRLTDLDAAFTAGLASCEHTDLVTSHTAFGYLADAYGLHQVGIAGLEPGVEPSASQMSAIVAHLREHDVPVIYAETLLPRDTAKTIAREAGAEVRVLDPLEGITSESAGEDYVAIMEANLDTLAEGQVCS